MFSSFGIKKKLICIGITLTLTPLLIVGAIVYRQTNEMTDIAAARTMEVAMTGLDDIGRGVYALCYAQQQLLQQNVNSTLNVARQQMQQSGPVQFSEDQIAWATVDQSSGTRKQVQLPRMLIGDSWLGQNYQTDAPSPVVDATAKLVGGTCTIFQRMNDAGDMLRVCTNVQTKDKTRAIGTYIPAVGADGKPNPVIAAVLRGQTFQGRAFVVDQWYITAYEPIQDEKNNIVGMLFVGVKQESTAFLRNEIMKIKVGQTGYVYVLDSDHKYVISSGGKRDGEAADANGATFIRDICKTAKALGEGELATVRYEWQNPTDPAPRAKIVRVAYFAPWDWIIGVGSYEEEFLAAEREIEAVGKAGNLLMMIITLIAVVVACGLWALIAGGLARKIATIVNSLTTGAEQTASAAGQVSSASQQLAAGASEQASALEETSSSLEEMSSMTRQNAANAKQAATLSDEARQASERGGQAVQRMSEAIDRIKQSSNETARIIKVIDEIAFQTNLLALNAAVEAARAGEAGKGFAVVAEEVRNLAQRSAEAARNTSQLIEESQKNADSGVKVTEQVIQELGSIDNGIRKVSDLLSEVAAASDEQSRGVEQVNGAVSQMDKVTQDTASGAEESAAASEELSAQAEQLNQMVNDLVAIVNGSSAAEDRRRTAAGSHSSSGTGRSSTPGSRSAAHAATGNAGRNRKAPQKSAAAAAQARQQIPLEEEDEVVMSTF